MKKKRGMRMKKKLNDEVSVLLWRFLDVITASKKKEAAPKRRQLVKKHNSSISKGRNNCNDEN